MQTVCNVALHPDFIVQHLGQDGYNCPWNAQLILNGEFYNGRGNSPESALIAAANAEPYTPADPPADDSNSFDLRSLIPRRPVYRRF